MILIIIMMMIVVMIKRTSRVFLPSKSTKNSLMRMALATCGGAESMNSSSDDVKMGDSDSSSNRSPNLAI